MSWTARETTRNWFAVAASADGSKLVAVVGSGQIYTAASEPNTSPGTTGWLSGAQYDAVRLQYIGSNVWMPLSAISYSGSFMVN